MLQVFVTSKKLFLISKSIFFIPCYICYIIIDIIEGIEKGYRLYPFSRKGIGANVTCNICNFKQNFPTCLNTTPTRD